MSPQDQDFFRRMAIFVFTIGAVYAFSTALLLQAPH
jgi:hypothetical protein